MPASRNPLRDATREEIIGDADLLDTMALRGFHVTKRDHDALRRAAAALRGLLALYDAGERVDNDAEWNVRIDNAATLTTEPYYGRSAGGKALHATPWGALEILASKPEGSDANA